MNERIRGDEVPAIRGEITHGPFAHHYMRAILEKFGKAAFGRASVCMEFDSFLRELISARGTEWPLGRTCLEIGTFHGVSAVMLSQYFERVIAVSIDVDPAKLLKHDICKHLGIGNITFVDARSNAQKRRVIEGLDFDFCYQDGDHTNDTEDDFALVRRCGRVLFHEYWPLQAPVWNLVNALPQQEVTRAKFDCLAYWERRRG